MNLNKDLRNVEKIRDKAWDLVLEGNFRGARNLLKRIRHSFCVSESERAIALVEAKILQMKGEYEAAKIRVRESMGYLWGISDGLLIASTANPKIDSGSLNFRIKILGGRATFGCFTQFSERHVGTFDVIADSREEALTYIKEVANFAEPERMLVLECTTTPLEAGEFRHRGVILTYPFEILKEQ